MTGRIQPGLVKIWRNQIYFSLGFTTHRNSRRPQAQAIYNGEKPPKESQPLASSSELFL